MRKRLCSVGHDSSWSQPGGRGGGSPRAELVQFKAWGLSRGQEVAPQALGNSRGTVEGVRGGVFPTTPHPGCQPGKGMREGTFPGPSGPHHPHGHRGPKFKFAWGSGRIRILAGVLGRFLDHSEGPGHLARRSHAHLGRL